ncbi:cell wall hydrolase [Novosphingobium sp. PhB165]|uniref:cell wall hydrolase n=1 Tax=Novosphingobium sp. PhB165 TaxID=2485105 RepID=UPI001FB39B83|nr:cell wall hydrolase [Novosphingobium sp. PhB165]
MSDPLQSIDGRSTGRWRDGFHAVVRARAMLLGAVMALAPGATVPVAGLAFQPASPAAALLTKTRAVPALTMSTAGLPPPATDAQAQLARTVNAAIPLAQGALFPAQPFYLDSSFADRSRALDCLAAADFYEAGGDPSDQRAVAQVVLNRVRHAAFPSTICGVVFEGADRPTGCQFTFTCDGSLFRRRPTPAAWQDARRVAAEMLLGRVEATVGQATHYHTDWVSPVWDRTMDKLAVVKTHLFFRWHGASGAPTFGKHYAGSEPRIALLAPLSQAHAVDGPLDGGQPASASALTAVATAGVPSPLASVPQAPAPSLQDQGIFLVTLPAGASPDSFRRIAEQRCAGFADCRFVGWTDSSRRANTLPLPGNSVDAISFTFVRHSNDKAVRVQWNCSEFPRVNTDECLQRAT